MRNQTTSRLAKKLTILAAIAAVSVVIGHGCSEFSSNNSSSSSGGSMGTAGGGGAGSGFTPLPNTLTVSLIYNKQIVDNMVACSGIGKASTATLAEWDKRQSSFSEYGYATDVTAPMFMAITALAGEICNDLLNLEVPLAAGSRRIFPMMNFAAGPSGLSQTAIADSVRRLARSCWAREETAEELNIIQTEISGALQGVNTSDAGQTRNAALMTCTGMLSSLSAVTL